MKIWLIAVGEPSLIDQGERLHRAGLMAKYYSENNHNVVLFNSTFFHQKEINRFKKTEIRKVNDNLSLVFLWGRDYKRHNFNRIFSNFENAKSFKEIISDLEKPDLVLVSFPILELVTEVRKYCIENNIPFIIDIRDFWPDAFFELFPKFFSPLLKAIFLWFNYSLKTSLKNASGLISPFASGLDWSKKKLYNKSQRSKNMNVIPFCPPNRDALSVEEIALKLQHPSKRRIKMVYVGNLTKLANIDWIIDLATEAENHNSILDFQIFGDGPRVDVIQEASKKLTNFQYKGWINESELIVIMKEAHFGILAYNSDVLIHGVPNKFVDYLSFSLPIYSCTKGKVRDLIKEHDIGIYSNENEMHATIKSIEELFLDEEKYIDISLNVQNLYRNHYSYDAVGIKLEKILNN